MFGVNMPNYDNIRTSNDPCFRLFRHFREHFDRLTRAFGYVVGVIRYKVDHLSVLGEIPYPVWRIEAFLPSNS